MRILLVTTRWPWPPRRGNQLRTVQMAEWLAGEHDVTVLTPGAPVPAAEPHAGLAYRVVTYRRGLLSSANAVLAATAAGRPVQSGLYDGRELRTSFARLLPDFDLVILQTVRLVRLLDQMGSAPICADLIDSLALNFERRALVDRPLHRALLNAEARRLRRSERRLLDRAQLSWVVSDRDAEYLARGLSPEAAMRLTVLPVAVAARSEERASEPTATADLAAKPLLAITGNLGYFPTVDGAVGFLSEVWPALAARRPNVRLVIAGARPAAALCRAVAAAGPGVELIASPEDLGAVLARATIALAPARCGSGVPIKVLEAWAAGVPVVAHPWTAAGVGAAEGELLQAAAPDAWIGAIERLLDEQSLAARLVAAGRSKLADYRPARVRAELLAAVRVLPAGQRR